MLFSLPTPPPSPLTPLSSPLPQIPSPPTHHPLPLLAPSTSRRSDIPEAELPPQKRLLLTTPTPRFEIGEGSTAATARYVHRQESEEFQIRHQDAQDDHATLRDEHQDADDRATGHIMHIQVLKAGARVDTLEDTGSNA
ncbi:hypothetical protein Tco_1035470 [Tanacetum coccineum]